MLEVILGGTSGTMPLKNRWLSSCFVRMQGKTMLIDCGEGTQIALKCAGLSFQGLDLLCLTHFHADHVSGLVGLLLSMGSERRTAPLTIVGPVGLRRVVEGLRVIAPELPFELVLCELTEEIESIPFGDATVTAFAVKHTLPCYGFCVTLPRVGKFDVARAESAGIPQKFWGRLQKMESVTDENGVVYEPSQVLGAPRKGLKLVYCTDTRPVNAIAKFADGADLFICEGMYGDADKLDKAVETGHMLYEEAAEIAALADVGTLWLTHFSPSMPEPEEFLPQAQAVFPRTVCGYDGIRAELRFVDT